MVAPLAFVVHADARFLLTSGFHQRAIGFDDGLIEEGVGLLPPDFQAGFMERFLQREHIELRKPATEISRRRGVRNPLSPEGIQVSLVIPPQFQMLQTCSSGEQIEGDVEHVIGLAVRQMKPQDRTLPIDTPGDIQLPHELLNGPDPSGGESLYPIRQFQSDRRRDEHRRLPVPVGLINPPGNATLPRFQSIPYNLLHLKTSL